ncbi:complement receptor type 2-like isoform X22 [Dreissena polymorpha]|uniref:complement receptor type 2-like isoform X22 n=1 Tax=Dreissena polymorpha TaxID=45954 RepID=UPI002265030B|nr:complement receptor type 2-like isoform X22 [Dreissena polymorpha]
MASVKTTTMSAFLVAIYIGVFCSASSNAENNGCLDLDNHTNWQAIGPHIQEIKYVRSSNRFRASVQCEPGYQGFVLFQQKYSDRFPMDCINGSWTFASPCMEVVCPDISNNDTWKTNGENIQRIEYLPSSLSTVTAHCLNGYEAISHNSSNDHFSVKCEQGVWVAEVAEGACQKKDCGPPLDWAHGTCIATNTTYQSIGLCSCNTGYTFTGRNNSIECLANGSWRVPDVNCTIKNCGNPLADPHRHDDTSNGTVFLSTVTFRCNEGYELVGANTSVCTELSKWRPDVPNCKIKDCGHPPDLAYGTCIAINTTFKSIVLCSCNTGYTFTGQNSGIECLANGSWRGPDGSCTIKNCGPPPYWAYGRCITTKTTYQSTGRCSCNTGYTFTGRNTSIECLANGSWRVPDGNCTIKNCGNPLADPHRHDDTSNSTVFLSTVTFLCNDGYELVGANTSVCTELSKWRPEVPNCKIKDCGPPPDLAHGTCIATSTTFRSIGRCSCTTGYHFTGRNSSTKCLSNGSWRGLDGSCAIKEPVIISFETNGSRFNGDNNILDTFQIPNRFPYFGTYYTLFRPSMNGFIALDFQPLYNQYGGETPSEWTAAIQKHIVIAPLWTDIDSRNISNGGLWIHVLTERDKADVLNIQDRVRQYTNQTEFNVSVALVATWKHVTVHSPYEPGYELVNHQNLSMQVILVTDGMFTYIMFNYDREQFSIRPLPEVSVASGYTHLDYSASVLSTRNNFTNLIKESNVNPSFPGRWLYNVTAITVSMLNETRCLQFVKANNYTLQSFITEQLVYALPCPCQEVLMLEDYTFTRKDEILPGIGTKFTHTTCYESWFFSAYGIKQRCCYMFSKLQSQYPGAVAAEFENSTIASLLQEGYYQCCSPDGSQKYCHLYQQINPPDDCSRYTISDEIQMADKKDSAKIEDLSVDVEK